MPILKYKDPADGLWKPVPVGGSAAPEVEVGSTQPTFVADGLWADTTAPVAPTVLNAYVEKAGDTMSGPLFTVAPTLITHAGRWADGVPRFADEAARDAAYLTIGGPVEGMTCWLLNWKQQQTFQQGRWFPTGGVMPTAFVSWNPGNISIPPQAIQPFGGVAADATAGAGAAFTFDPEGKFALPFTGTWTATLQMAVTDASNGTNMFAAAVMANAGAWWHATTAIPPNQAVYQLVSATSGLPAGAVMNAGIGVSLTGLLGPTRMTVSLIGDSI